MKLQEVLDKINAPVTIECRRYVELPDESEMDILAGYCRYEPKPFPKLIPMDGDSYSFYDDVLPNWEFTFGGGSEEDLLTVWWEQIDGK